MSEQQPDPYFIKLRSMNDDELREELGEERAKELDAAFQQHSERTELLHRAYLAMQALADPEGNMPEDTGEFRSIRESMDEIGAHLGIAPYSQEEAQTITQPYLDRSPFSGIEVTRGIDYSDACQPREMQATLEIGEGKLAFAAV